MQNRQVSYMRAENQNEVLLQKLRKKSLQIQPKSKQKSLDLGRGILGSIFHGHLRDSFHRFLHGHLPGLLSEVGNFSDQGTSDISSILTLLELVKILKFVEAG